MDLGKKWLQMEQIELNAHEVQKIMQRQRLLNLLVVNFSCPECGFDTLLHIVRGRSTI